MDYLNEKQLVREARRELQVLVAVRWSEAVRDMAAGLLGEVVKLGNQRSGERRYASVGSRGAVKAWATADLMQRASKTPTVTVAPKPVTTTDTSAMISDALTPPPPPRRALHRPARTPPPAAAPALPACETAP